MPNTPEKTPPPLRPVDPHLLDTAKTLARLDGDWEFVRTMYQVFGEEIPGRISQFEAAVAAGDMAALCKKAHSLKGAAATIDAEQLRQRALDMEMAAREGNPAKVQAAYAGVRTELDRLNGILASLLKINSPADATQS